MVSQHPTPPTPPLLHLTPVDTQLIHCSNLIHTTCYDDDHDGDHDDDDHNSDDDDDDDTDLVGWELFLSLQLTQHSSECPNPVLQVWWHLAIKTAITGQELPVSLGEPDI